MLYQPIFIFSYQQKLKSKTKHTIESRTITFGLSIRRLKEEVCSYNPKRSKLKW